MSHGRSPGNLHASYPFQIIAMDHIPSLPKSIKGNTELLIWVDLFSGYVIAKASSSRTAQTIAENYEECVFGALELAKLSGTIENRDLCPTSFEPSAGS